MKFKKPYVTYAIPTPERYRYINNNKIIIIIFIKYTEKEANNLFVKIKMEILPNMRNWQLRTKRWRF